MKTILIVDDEPSLTLSLKAGLEAYNSDFRVLIADNGGAAVEIVESTSVDLMLTDLKMPKMDGFQLLAYMKTNFSSLPSIVMTAFYTPDIERQLRIANAVTLIEKPIDFDELMRCVNVALNTSEGEGPLAGISLSGFLQLIEMEGKTCLLEVRGEDNLPGLFYFNQGELYDTLYKGLKGEQAVYEMLALENVRIAFKNPPTKRIKKRIGVSLMKMLMDGPRRGVGLNEDGVLNVDAVIDAVEDMDRHQNAMEKASPDAGGSPGSDGDVPVEELFESEEEWSIDDIMDAAGEPGGEDALKIDHVIEVGEGSGKGSGEGSGEDAGKDPGKDPGNDARRDAAPRENFAAGEPDPLNELTFDDVLEAGKPDVLSELTFDKVREAGKPDALNELTFDELGDAGGEFAADAAPGGEKEITEDDLVFILDDDDESDSRDASVETRADDMAPPGPVGDFVIPGEPGPISREKAAPGLNEHLEKLKFISGFQLVGVFTPLGEIIAEV
ncbi:MAG: response regulator, partial [Desulfobacterales bacterium]|nr:response regulator [Desulfobacterales bacterium]